MTTQANILNALSASNPFYNNGSKQLLDLDDSTSANESGLQLVKKDGNYSRLFLRTTSKQAEVRKILAVVNRLEAQINRELVRRLPTLGEANTKGLKVKVLQANVQKLTDQLVARAAKLETQKPASVGVTPFGSVALAPALTSSQEVAVVADRINKSLERLDPAKRQQGAMTSRSMFSMKPLTKEERRVRQIKSLESKVAAETGTSDASKARLEVYNYAKEQLQLKAPTHEANLQNAIDALPNTLGVTLQLDGTDATNNKAELEAQKPAKQAKYCNCFSKIRGSHRPIRRSSRLPSNYCKLRH